MKAQNSYTLLLLFIFVYLFDISFSSIAAENKALSENGSEDHLEKSFAIYNRLAEQGDSAAQYNLALMYYKGEGIEQSYEKAFKWYKKAADNNLPDAQYNLALMYENGLGVKKNYEKAVELYKKAAESGNSNAMNNLAVMYEQGDGVSCDYSEAIKWYIKAAEKEDAVSQYNLAIIFYGGKKTTQNYIEAVKWLKKSSENSYVPGILLLAYFYAEGECGLKKDINEAIKWYKKAIVMGSHDAESNLAALLADAGENLEYAKELADKSLKYNPSNPYYYSTYGWVLYKLGDYKNAIKNIEWAIGIFSDEKVTPEIKKTISINKYRLAKVYLKLGRKHEADREWTEALKMTEDETLKEEIQNNLKELKEDKTKTK